MYHELKILFECSIANGPLAVRLNTNIVEVISHNKLHCHIYNPQRCTPFDGLLQCNNNHILIVDTPYGCWWCLLLSTTIFHEQVLWLSQQSMCFHSHMDNHYSSTHSAHTVVGLDTYTSTMTLSITPKPRTSCNPYLLT